MPSATRAAIALLCLASDSLALRKQKTVTSEEGNTEEGKTEEVANATSSNMVHGLYTFGAPGTSTTAFRNGKRSDGVFPGIRQWNSDGNRVDVVAMITNAVGYHHATMLGVDQGPSIETNYSATSSGTTMTPFGVPSEPLHKIEMSLERFRRIHRSGLVSDIAQVGAGNSYVWNYNQMFNNLAGTGWDLRSLAFHNGGVYGTGGAQVSHVLRHSSTGNCILTFQGTKTDEDWRANFDFGRADFCGLPGRVHKGFRDHLRRMVQSNDFQSYSKPELARCRQVYVTGHSLGGAMSEMFTACANRASAPTSREDPDRDYQFISFR